MSPKQLSALLHRFITAKQAAGRSALTTRWYSQQVGYFLNWLGEGPCTDLPATIDAYLAHQRTTGVKPSTVAASYRALSAWLNWCAKRRLIDGDPIADVDRPAVPKERRRFVSEQECASVLAAMQGGEWADSRDRLIVHVLYFSGLRAAELIALIVGDIDTRAATVHVRQGKGMKARIVPVHPSVGGLLARYLYERPPYGGAELLVSNDGSGGIRGPLTQDGLRQLLRRRCESAGVDYLHPHAWRHGFAMWTLNAGVQLSGVSALMGHGDTRITEQVYAHWQIGALQRQYGEALSRMQGK